MTTTAVLRIGTAASGEPFTFPAEAAAGRFVALGKQSGAILSYLVSAGPLTKAAIAQYTGYSITSSGFEGALRELRENGLIAITRDVVRPTVSEAHALSWQILQQ